jgi:predicted nuclease of restriction endonuclease-like (RecB) superfamily
MEITQKYTNWLFELKHKINQARYKTALSVNADLIALYWEIGKEIVSKELNASWGGSLIDKLSRDLTLEYPDMKGFSRRNLYAIRQFYLFFSQRFEFVPQPVAQIPWGHSRLIITKIKDIDEALFYAASIVENGWSRDFLEEQITKDLYYRKGKSITNFDTTLPQLQSKLATQVLKDPYNFDFLGLGDDAQEREVELELMKRITDFMLELGKGFAFVGRQYKLIVSDNEYFIDLLFYHLELRSYVVIELKSGKFKPEYAGKLNFYLSAIDSQVKRPEDNPSIGIIICKSKDKIEAEYSLRDINKPIGISDYILTQVIPENMSKRLPSVEELEEELFEKVADIDKD